MDFFSRIKYKFDLLFREKPTKLTFPFEVKYMQGMVAHLNRNRSKKGWYIEGVAENDIEAVENKIGKNFPQAYREYLLIAGNDTPFIHISAFDYQFDYTVLKYDYNNATRSELKKYNKEITRDYWVFVTCGEVIFFFFFDEGDNPPVYLYFIQPDPPEFPDYITKRFNSFSDYIEALISGYSI